MPHVFTAHRNPFSPKEATGSYTGSNLAAGLGDTVTYEYSISNNGTTTMSRLTVEDTVVSSSIRRDSLLELQER